MPNGRTRNWLVKTYTDRSGERHRDPYMVFYAEPKNPNKTAPTYGDVLAFVEGALRVEGWNDEHLDRPPWLPRLLKLLDVVIRGATDNKWRIESDGT